MCVKKEQEQKGATWAAKQMRTKKHLLVTDRDTHTEMTTPKTVMLQ